MSLPITQSQIPPNVIDLGAGEPNQAMFPIEMIRRAAEERLAQSDLSFLQYGAEQGNGYFRLTLANFLTRGYGHPTNPENIFVTAGISSALDLLCTLFTQTGDTIFVEEITYFAAPEIFADHYLNVVPIAMDKNGLIIESLEENLRIHKPKFIYTIPIHHNPTGTTLIETRRARLLELAQQFDFLILADEVYQLLSYTADPPMPFAAHLENEHIVSLGSFSKIIAPGLRLGWIQAHANIIKRILASGVLDSGGGMNPFTSAIIRGAIEAGDLEKHIEKLKLRYQNQLSAMVEALRLHLPNILYQVPNGGYFIWLCLPEHINASELRKQAKTFNVDFRQGTLFSSTKGAQSSIRLCFARYNEAQIKTGILRLKECLGA